MAICGWGATEVGEPAMAEGMMEVIEPPPPTPSSCVSTII